MSINPMLLCDFYKTTHSRQFPKGTTELTSYFTPRMSRLTDINSIVVFGVQAFCQEYLIDYFDEHFFQRNLADVTDEIETVLDNTIGKRTTTVQSLLTCTTSATCLLRSTPCLKAHFVPSMFPSSK